MNKQLWNLVLDFDLDKPMSEYGFSTRLAHENHWPASFTQEAILEYKKFMYLAATAGTMVSPSEIVDVVWHQHLLFTQSYEDFCKVLGKKIAHVPSTHDRSQAEIFRKAKSDTARLYRETFGPQPIAIWDRHSLNDSLELEPSKRKVRNLLLAWIALILVLAKPSYLLLEGTWSRISSDAFLPAFIAISGLVVLSLRLFNRRVMQKFLDGLPGDHFLFKLTPEELIYMKTGNAEHIIHSKVNRMVREEKLKILKDRRLENVSTDYTCSDNHEYTIREYIGSGKRVYYNLLQHLGKQPVFHNTESFVKKLLQHLTETKLFVRMFITNLVALFIPLMIGMTRVATGIVRGKPVFFLALLLIVFGWMVFSLLKRSVTTLTKVVINRFYQNIIEALPSSEKTMEWRYFLLGKDIVSASLIPVIIHANYEKTSISWAWEWGVEFPSGNGGISGCGSGCSGGCGSGCGGGCGGCGS